MLKKWSFAITSRTARFTSARPRGSTGRPGRLAHRRTKYAPELNDIEVVWPDLKAFNLASKMFTDADTPDAAIHTAIADLNTERNRDLLGGQD
jgi:hypothetical protein